MSIEIDVVMPTKESSDVIVETLGHLKRSLGYAGSPDLNTLIVIDDRSLDDTFALVQEVCSHYDWTLEYRSYLSNLAEARQHAIALVETEWFLFLDDDVRLDPDYLSRIVQSISPSVGAVQGRKHSRTEHPSDWVRRRSRRGGAHATLVRTEAVTGLSMPTDVTVMEDQYIRRHVESEGWLWIFDHQARFEHVDQGRHPIGFEEGYVSGKYDLYPGHVYALNVPYAMLTLRNPLPHLKRFMGYCLGLKAQPDEQSDIEELLDDDH